MKVSQTHNDDDCFVEDVSFFPCGVLAMPAQSMHKFSCTQLEQATWDSANVSQASMLRAVFSRIHYSRYVCKAAMSKVKRVDAKT